MPNTWAEIYDLVKDHRATRYLKNPETLHYVVWKPTLYFTTPTRWEYGHKVSAVTATQFIVSQEIRNIIFGLQGSYNYKAGRNG